MKGAERRGDKYDPATGRNNIYSIMSSQRKIYYEKQIPVYEEVLPKLPLLPGVICFVH